MARIKSGFLGERAIILPNPVINEFKNTKKLLYLAKKSHENYLLKSQEADLQNAIDYYVQAMKVAPHISEPYYKLSILLYSQNQISVDQGIEQCRKLKVFWEESWE